VYHKRNAMEKEIS